MTISLFLKKNPPANDTIIALFKKTLQQMIQLLHFFIKTLQQIKNQKNIINLKKNPISYYKYNIHLKKNSHSDNNDYFAFFIIFSPAKDTIISLFYKNSQAND